MKSLPGLEPWEVFQSLCRELLLAEGFVNVGKTGRGSDLSRDLIAEEDISHLTGHRTTLRWLISCKFTLSENAVGVRDLEGSFLALRTHNCDGLLIITNYIFSTNVIIRIEQLNNSIGAIWPGMGALWDYQDLQVLLIRHSHILERYFGSVEESYRDRLTEIEQRGMDSLKIFFSALEEFKDHDLLMDKTRLKTISSVLDMIPVNDHCLEFMLRSVTSVGYDFRKIKDGDVRFESAGEDQKIVVKSLDNWLKQSKFPIYQFIEKSLLKNPNKTVSTWIYPAITYISKAKEKELLKESLNSENPDVLEFSVRQFTKMLLVQNEQGKDEEEVELRHEEKEEIINIFFNLLSNQNEEVLIAVSESLVQYEINSKMDIKALPRVISTIKQKDCTVSETLSRMIGDLIEKEPNMYPNDLLEQIIFLPLKESEIYRITQIMYQKDPGCINAFICNVSSKIQRINDLSRVKDLDLRRRISRSISFLKYLEDQRGLEFLKSLSDD